MALIVLALCAGNLWFTLARSTIPFELNGKVESVDVLTEKHPGLDDVYLVRIGDREIQVDEAVARSLRVGDHIRKDSWTWEILNLSDVGTSIRLTPSKDFWGMGRTMPVVLIAASLVLFTGRKRRTDRAEIIG